MYGSLIGHLKFVETQGHYELYGAGSIVELVNSWGSFGRIPMDTYDMKGFLDQRKTRGRHLLRLFSDVFRQFRECLVLYAEAFLKSFPKGLKVPRKQSTSYLI